MKKTSLILSVLVALAVSTPVTSEAAPPPQNKHRVVHAHKHKRLHAPAVVASVPTPVPAPVKRHWWHRSTPRPVYAARTHDYPPPRGGLLRFWFHL